MNQAAEVIKRSPRLLVIEDEESVRAALKKYFSAANYSVDCATELEEAEALLATSAYDVVIADLRLSWSYSTEGLEILRFVRHHSRRTRVVILSAYGSAEMQCSAMDLGASAFLQKPSSLDDIFATVDQLVEVHP